MENSQYVIFDILGVKQNGHKNSFRFDKDAECVINADKFINKLVISSDISKATFYLHDSIKISENNVSEIVNYLSLYLSNMMISLVKNSIHPETAKYFLHFPIFCPLCEHPTSLPILQLHLLYT